MPDLPITAMPGEVHRGPDNRWYHLGWDEKWRLHPRSPRHDHDPELGPEDDGPSPEEIAYDEANNRRIMAEEAAEARRHAAARAAAAQLPALPQRHGYDDQQVSCFEGDFAAVIAEVPADQRADGWTAERRVLFLDRLAEHGSVLAACRAVNLSREAARKLRRRAPAFDAAYREALAQNVAVLADYVFDRAIHGSERQVYQKGALVGTRTVHHDALACYLLRVRDPLNYAPIDELDRWQKHRPLEASAEPGRPALPNPKMAE
jgi:hypothetical protein